MLLFIIINKEVLQLEEDKKREEAAAAFEAVRTYMDGRNLHYSADEEDLNIECNFTGPNLPIEMRIHVFPDQHILLVSAAMPFTMKKEKRVDAAIAVCMANDSIMNGRFEYKIGEGQISFRLAEAYHGMELSSEVIDYAIGCTIGTFTRMSERFFGLNAGMIDLEHFLPPEKKED